MSPDSRLVKVKTTDLKIGMFVADVGRGWLRHPWKTKSKLITSHQDIAQLLEHNISEVLVDLSKCEIPNLENELGLTQKDVKTALQITTQEVSSKVEAAPTGSIRTVERRQQPRPEKPLDNVGLDEELPRARQAYSQALNVTRQFINDVRAGKKIQVERVQASVNDMIDSVFRNRGAITALMKLRNYDEYTFTHSLNVAALAISTGRQIGLSRQDLMNLGLGAIFHDVGKTGVPDAILNKPSRLTDEEFAVMKTHPLIGAELLADKHPELSPRALSIVRHHHERQDGSGYPDGLAGELIDEFSVICGMADVYDALSSDRVYHKGMLPHEALKVVFSLRGKHFPQVWTDRFVQCLGIYPIGTTVRLKTGEVGVVTVVNYANLVRPRLRLVLDGKGRALPMARDVDLNQAEGARAEIVKVLDPKALGLDPAKYVEG